MCVRQEYGLEKCDDQDLDQLFKTDWRNIDPFITFYEMFI